MGDELCGTRRKLSGEYNTCAIDIIIDVIQNKSEPDSERVDETKGSNQKI